MNAGQATIDWLFREQLKVDAQWSERDANGFTWWADQNAQRIEILRRESDPGLGESFFIRVQTELLCDLTLNERALTFIGTALMPTSSMCGPVYDPKTRRLSLSSLVRVHEGIREWMARLISMAAVLQVGEARIIGPTLQELIGGRFAKSGHPRSGLRPEPDEMAEVIALYVAPVGQKPPAWSAGEFETAVKSSMMQPPSLGATYGKNGLAVEFPWGDFSSLCQMSVKEKHPRYGNGLLVTQSFPVKVADELAGFRLALELNAQELDQNAAGYGFGSYCYREKIIQFCTFLPNASYQQHQLRHFYSSCAARAHRMSRIFCGDDWPELSRLATPAQKQSFAKRLTRNISRMMGKHTYRYLDNEESAKNYPSSMIFVGNIGANSPKPTISTPLKPQRQKKQGQ